MSEVYIRTDDLNCWIKDYLPPNRDMFSISDLLGAMEDMISKIDELNERIDDLEQDIEDNYIPISKAEQYGISDSDFI